MTERQILLFYRVACQRAAAERQARIVDANAATDGRAARALIKALDG